ncbi:MAG: hypothetical protein KDA89_00920 [Planctomycetaceae bacterium]|nr:hypothetical protein [Planctomycetaceae bacterium]
MLSRFMVWAAIVAVTCGSAAHGQYYGGGGCSSCGTAAPAPVVSSCGSCASSCTPIQPVYSSCYETVPVTTYAREKQTVQVPYYETTYEDREVTTYRPVTQQRTVEVPSVSYQTVMENRTVNRDMGRWQTNYFPTSKCAPCQVDPRPGVIGWLNRSGYAFRNAFTPNYRTTQTYVPRMVTCNVQVPRQVAVQTTRKVVVNDVKMVAERKTERVPVQKLSYRSEERTVLRPQTAYRTVPIGSTLAYGYGGYYGGTSTAFIIDDSSTQTAQRPTPDPISGSQSAQAPFPADSDAPRTGDKTFQRDNDAGKFHRSSYEQPLPSSESIPLKKTPQPAFPADDATSPSFDSFPHGSRSDNARDDHFAFTPPAPSGGWKSSRRVSVRENTARNDIRIPGLSMTERPVTDRN